MRVDDAPAVGQGGTAGRDDRDERWYLTDQRDFLRRSLEDADRELEAGDLSAEDHALLVARDRARLTEVEAELDAFGDTPAASTGAGVAVSSANGPGEVTEGDGADDATPPRRRLSPWRWVGIVASSLLIVVGLVILVVHFVQAGQPGQPISGSVTLSQAQKIEQQLNQALTLNNQGDTKGALELYDAVLTEDPSNPAALASAGFLQWNLGSTHHVPSLVRIGRA
ncbi:MAG TPA: hypothetical protein VHD39_04730, partial [Acidimicrobiales bacterium]|nr:hypothetical protein [Acidimicrobiales bacterium]